MVVGSQGTRPGLGGWQVGLYVDLHLSSSHNGMLDLRFKAGVLSVQVNVHLSRLLHICVWLFSGQSGCRGLPEVSIGPYFPQSVLVSVDQVS